MVDSVILSLVVTHLDHMVLDARDFGPKKWTTMLWLIIQFLKLNGKKDCRMRIIYSVQALYLERNKKFRNLKTHNGS